MRKSEAARRNRAAMPDALKHTAGSISFGQHKNKMEAELKHPVSYRDLYAKVHKKKDGSYVSERSRNFIESYDTAMSEKYGENSSTHPMVDPHVWLDATGPNKKGRVHGIGNSLHINNNSMHASSSEVTGPSRSTPLTQDITEAVNTAVSAAVTTAMASFVQTQLVPMFAPFLSTIQSVNVAPQAPLQGEATGEGQEDDDYEDEDEANLD